MVDEPIALLSASRTVSCPLCYVQARNLVCTCNVNFNSFLLILCRYKEGAGSSARFHYVSAMEFISQTQLVVADKENHCIRLISMLATPESERFAGTCQTSDDRDGNRLSEALLNDITDMEFDARNGKLYMNDYKAGKLKVLLLSSDQVQTCHLWSHEALYMLLMSPTQLSFTFRHGISMLNLESSTEHDEVGSTNEGLSDGAYEDTRFKLPQRQTFLPNHNVRLVPDRQNNR